MYYEINVSKDGVHYFATAERSLTTNAQALNMYTHFCGLFPERDGYEIRVTSYETTGRRIKFNRPDSSE